jgi:hypothetical protein
MVRIAFYKGKGRFFDKLIRLWTRGPYSHCELVFSDGQWFSASPREKVARFKRIEPKPGHWDFVDLPMAAELEALIRQWCEGKAEGRKYDWLGIICTQIMPFGWQDKGRWFCSEVCLSALQWVGLFPGKKPHWVHPNELYKIITQA